ncbi:MAG: hypothetical protein K8T89_12115 [Planctomycetes bacterium]|nr:hypothetical protein [Planctomycetota bacterium]
MRKCLPILLLSMLIMGLTASPGASQFGGTEERVRHTNLRKFFIPFTADPKRPISELRLFVQRNGGEWEYLTTAQPTQKGFNFFTNQDGSYGMTVQTVYQDGSTEPTRDQLKAELKVVIDTIPPKITLRPFSTADGSAGVEWEATDEYVDPSSIKLEYRWPGMVDWAPIDKGVQFRSKDQRTWVLKPDQRIEIRVKASDFAKNETTSLGVTTSSTIGDNRQFGNVTNGGNNTNTGGTDTTNPNRISGTQHYVNSTTVKLNYNVTVGPSGVRKVTLWRLDDKQVWSKVLEKEANELKPDKEIPAFVPGDKPRSEPLTLTHDVVKDGTYGFIIIVESRAGASGKEPKLGDAPHTTVVVDTTPPVVKLGDPKVRPNGTAAQGALVDIVWQATDKNLAPAPITLEYAEKLTGPWRIIADKIDNTGKYTWAVPPTEPYSFFVRIKTIDRAGNVTTDECKQNVIVDLTVPQVEIRDVAPGK